MKPRNKPKVSFVADDGKEDRGCHCKLRTSGWCHCNPVHLCTHNPCWPWPMTSRSKKAIRNLISPLGFSQPLCLLFQRRMRRNPPCGTMHRMSRLWRLTPHQQLDETKRLQSLKWSTFYLSGVDSELSILLIQAPSAYYPWRWRTNSWVGSLNCRNNLA